MTDRRCVIRHPGTPDEAETVVEALEQARCIDDMHAVPLLIALSPALAPPTIRPIRRTALT